MQYGIVTVDIFASFKVYIASSLNVLPIKGFYYLYKRVLKVKQGEYKSIHDPDFKYFDGKVARVEDYDPNITVSCSKGIHVSTPFYWSEGDTLIAVKVKESDVITCQEGKLRCKAITVIGEIKL